MTDWPALDAFPPASRNDWLAAAVAALKGRPADDLRTRLADGVEIDALSARPKGRAAIAGRPAGRIWTIVQRIDHPSPAEANALARDDLAGGATGFTLVVEGAPTARGFGLALAGPGDLALAIAGLPLDRLSIRLEAGSRAGEIARWLGEVAESQGVGIGAVDLSVGIDPPGLAAAGLDRPLASLLGGLAETPAPRLLMTADGRPFAEAGAPAALELALALGSGVDALRALETAGLALDEAHRRVEIALTADADFVVTIPKLRAIRLLWARVEEACGLEPLPVRLHAESAWAMATRRDPWTDILRGTLAAFAAGVAGADSVAVLPFTAALGLPDGFARRVSRNAQNLLLHEANLHRVADPAAGSGAFEAMTDALCERAWSHFQDLERTGGIMAALASGRIAGMIAKARAGGPEPAIVGTSCFVAETAETGHVLADAPAGPSPPAPLSPRRGGEPFEGVSR